MKGDDLAGDGVHRPADLAAEIWGEATSLERLLVVSSNMQIRVVLADALEGVGYRIRAATSPEDAARVVGIEMPDLVIVDLAVDDPTVFAGASSIRAAAFPHNLPILALTGEPASEIMLRSHGIDRAVTTPVRLDDLVREIQSLVEPARVHRPERASAAQLAMDLQDRVEADHLVLATTFPAWVSYDPIPENDPYVAELRAQLNRMSIPAETIVRDGQLVVTFSPTIAEAFTIGINRFARDELFFALMETYPELADEPERLRARIHVLEDEYLRLQRRAG